MALWGLALWEHHINKATNHSFIMGELNLSNTSCDFKGGAVKVEHIEKYSSLKQQEHYNRNLTKSS